MALIYYLVPLDLRFHLQNWVYNHLLFAGSKWLCLFLSLLFFLKRYVLMTSEMDGLTGSSLFCFIILRQNVIFSFWYFFCKDISVK